jgi:uncharacterized protein (DUF1800 family)
MNMLENKPIDPRWAWERYKPSDAVPWNLQRVGHLYRRAGFGATYAELQAGLKLTPDELIDQLLKGGLGQDDFATDLAPLAESITKTNNAAQLRAWWLHRMLYSPHPLHEKMTLFWHNHFATSNAKVQNAGFMLAQYALLHKYALGSFRDLLQEMSTKDRAMLDWLDGRASKKGNPNENYARELMELFSLDRGHYTEADIREAARAFTGYDLRGNELVFTAANHDDGEKTFFGKTGKFEAKDIVAMCLEKPACPVFLATKLFRFLVSETITPTPELLAPLCEQLTKTDFDFGQLVSTVLRSNLFFSADIYRTRIKSPVEFALGIARGLEGRIGTSALANALELLGQNVFNPPSVKGWDGGQSWLNGQTLLYRQNLALALTSTEDVRFGKRLDPAELAKKYGRDTQDQALALFEDVFLQGDLPAESRHRLEDYARQGKGDKLPVYWTREDATKHRVRSLCHLVLTQPEFQLC